jgi:tape measure domain-containing protein
VGGGADLAKAQKDIYDTAQRAGLGLQETTELYTKMYAPVKRLGGGVNETTAIVEAFAASLKVGGASTQAAASATLQFAQAMGSGKLQGDEFRSMAEASPRFMQALAEGMGVPTEQLKKMGSEGKLTADVVGNALMKSLGQLKTEMASIPDTFGAASQRFKNDVMLAVGELNKTAGTTLGLAGAVEEARKLIPAVKDELAARALGKRGRSPRATLATCGSWSRRSAA